MMIPIWVLICVVIMGFSIASTIWDRLNDTKAVVRDLERRIKHLEKREGL